MDASFAAQALLPSDANHWIRIFSLVDRHVLGFCDFD